jgi:nucleotide-binding universal stress UspA family protein
VFESLIESVEPSSVLVKYATELARSNGAKLSILVGLCRLNLPSAGVLAETHALVAEANMEQRRLAQDYAEQMLRLAQGAGVESSMLFAHENFQDLCAQVVAAARTSDLTVMSASDENLSIDQGVLEETLFHSGKPMLIVPASHVPSLEQKVVIAWDGSAKSARAVADAIPFIEQAREVEIVIVEGDSKTRKRTEAADPAPQIARHCRNVQTIKLPCVDGNVARVLSEHLTVTRASMLVMGAYGHSRWREMILGGVTESMLRKAVVPVLMSY